MRTNLFMSALAVALTNASPHARRFLSDVSSGSHVEDRQSGGEHSLTIPSDLPKNASLGEVTTDGTCGYSHDNTVCGDYFRGSCCSIYGYCGSGTSFCGEGCQSGPCGQLRILAAPEASAAPANPNPGAFTTVGTSGVPVMHAALMPNGRVVFLDKVENYTMLNLPTGKYAYSAEYDPPTTQLLPLAYKSNAFCAGGAFLPNGTLLTVGGSYAEPDVDDTITDGLNSLRYLTRPVGDYATSGMDWTEPGNLLNSARWYPSVQTMPDGTIFVASGSFDSIGTLAPEECNPTYEILDQNGISQSGSIPMEILFKTRPYLVYPFIHLLSDGNLFVFASMDSEIFSVASNSTIKSFAELPGMHRTYPNTAGSVLLPLSSENNWAPDIVICGGGVFMDTNSPTDPSCGRIKPLDDDANWEMDSMPEGRVMVEGTLLLDGTVLWNNGSPLGSQGYNYSHEATTTAWIYDPNAALEQRWQTDATSSIWRMYHSVALMLLDGTILVAGSAESTMPLLQPIEYNTITTEFRVEVYTPHYLMGDNANRRPTEIVLSGTDLKADSSTFTVDFSVPENAEVVQVVLYHGGFVTHSLHMGQRMMFLDNEGFVPGSDTQQVTVTMPPNTNVAPPGPYVVYVVVDEVPGIGQFVMVS